MMQRTALLIVFLFSFSCSTFAQIFSYREIKLTRQDCQSFELFNDIDSLETLSIHESYRRHYSVFYITYDNGSRSEKNHVPVEFYDELKRKLDKGENGPISLLSRPRKAYQVMTLTKRDIVGKKLTWEGFMIQVSYYDTTQYVKADDIERIYQVRQKAIRNGEYAPDDPTPHKLFLMPTGRAKKGFGFGLVDHMVIFPGFNMSLPLNITLDGGLIPFEFWGFEDTHYYWFAPKVSLINHDNFSLGIGAFQFFLDYNTRDSKDIYNETVSYNRNSNNTFDLSYIVSTVGNKTFSFTYGVMFERLTTNHILQKNTLHSDKVNYFYGAELKVATGLKFLGEVLMPDADDKIGILGLRLYSESASAEAGLIFFQTEEGLEFTQIPFACFNFYLK